VAAHGGRFCHNVDDAEASDKPNGGSRRREVAGFQPAAIDPSLNDPAWAFIQQPAGMQKVEGVTETLQVLRRPPRHEDDVVAGVLDAVQTCSLPADEKVVAPIRGEGLDQSFKLAVADRLARGAVRPACGLG